MLTKSILLILCLITPFINISGSEVKLRYKNNYSYPYQEELTLNNQLLGYCLAKTTLENENLILNNHRQYFPELFSYLAGNEDYDYSSGQEVHLKNWILQQKDNSIDPIKLLKYSLQLNNGDLFLAILTIHTLLRNEARFYADYIAYESTYEKRTIFYNKFIDLRGDLEERGDPQYRGDHAGSWYRIWGIYLYLLDHSIFYNQSENKFFIEKFLWQEKLIGWSTSNAAEWIKILFGPEWKDHDQKKAQVNKSAANTAYYFYTALRNPQIINNNLDQLGGCKPSIYLDVN